MRPLWLYIAFLAFISCAVSVSFGKPRAKSVRIKTPSIVKDKRKPKSHWEVGVQARQYDYLSDSALENQANRVFGLGLDLEYKNLEGPVFAHGELLAVGFIYLSDGSRESESLSAEDPYYSIPNLYFGFGSEGAPMRLSLGRKEMTWSELDDQWNLGVWQPNARWDYTHPVAMGLTGAFLDIRFHSDFRATLWGTPFFLPDQGPHFELVDGKFESSNRWFWAPQSSIGILSEPSSLYYELERPSESEVINHYGVGGKLEFGNLDYGFWSRAAYAYKPMNQLHLGIEGRAQISEIGQTNRTRVTIHPEVVYHKVASAEIGWTYPSFSFWASASMDDPDESKQPETWVQSELNKTYFYGAGISHPIRPFGKSKGWLRYSYLKAVEEESGGGVTGPQSQFLGSSLDSSMDRFFFSEVISTEWVQILLQRSKYFIRSGFKYTYSMPDEAGMISAGVKLDYLKKWTIGLSMDILGSSRKADNAGSGLISRYRTNDRVSLGVKYAF